MSIFYEINLRNLLYVITFQGHKNKLLARLREALKDDYED